MWKEQRRFLHERLRHFGIKHMGDGRDKMEALIMVGVFFCFVFTLVIHVGYLHKSYIETCRVK